MSLLLILISGMVLIVLAADYFTNGIEWLGYSVGLEEGAVGSLLAALGTALPETLIPVMAIVFGGNSTSDAIGIGAILGAPLMLSTLAFMIIGFGLWAHGRREPVLPKGAVERDLGFFLVGFTVALGSGLTPLNWHRPLAALLVLGYGIQVYRLIRASLGAKKSESPPRRLHLSSRVRPPFTLVLVQVAMALFGLILGAHFFVVGLDRVSLMVKVPGFLLSVILTPVATELPEVLNSVLWIRRRKDGLAFGNVTGAMAFQATVVPALGMAFTPWRLSAWEIAAGVIAWGSAAWIFSRCRQGRLTLGPLLTAGLFYLAFIGLVAAGI